MKENGLQPGDCLPAKKSRQRKYPPLTKAQQKLVEEHMWIAGRLAHSARRLTGGFTGCYTKDDLEGVAFLALCVAATRFQPELGWKFSTFAWGTARGWIQHALRDHSRIVKVPRWIAGVRQEVRDIDEDAFRHDQARSRFYGDMQVPGEGRYLQHTKVGGRESQELVAADIAAWVKEQLEQGFLYIVGPGSTTAAIMAELGLDNTLLGVDVVRDRQLLLADANEVDLLEIIAEYSDPAKIFVTAIGGQGHIFGRGNQQLSPQVIRAVGVDGVSVVAAKSKISSLDGRPLLVDTNDPQLDAELCGYREVITGYDDRILYPVASTVKTEEA